MIQSDPVLKLIDAICNSFDDAVKVYTNGGCFQFYLILRSVFPDAKPYYDSNHIITRIGDRYYDITGRILNVDNFYPLTIERRILVGAFRWRFKENVTA